MKTAYQNIVPDVLRKSFADFTLSEPGEEILKEGRISDIITSKLMQFNEA